MEYANSPSAVRKGQFLWMDEANKKNYLENLNRKISEGYYYSEKILSKIVDEIAPILGDIGSD